jgi:N,N'-diacetyllegionaminate synthase
LWANRMSVFVIAEAACCHNGDVDLALKLADVAKRAGADAVKFQTFWSLADLKAYELTKPEWKKVKAYCDYIGIEFMSTPFDFEAIDFLAELGMKKWKVPSGEITNVPYLQKIGALKKEVIVSSGMCSLAMLGNAMGELISAGAPAPICKLLCTTAYPAKPEEMNLLAMNTVFDGLSDHSTGFTAAVMAVALEAEVIEKHITLDNNMEGPDHKMALDPRHFEYYVKVIREAEKMLGDGQKRILPCEEKYLCLRNRAK